MSTGRLYAVPVLVGILCVAGLGLSAATLTSAQVEGGGETGYFEFRTLDGDTGMEPNVSGPNINGPQIPTGPGFPDITSCNDFLSSPLGILSVLGGLGAVMGVLYRRYNSPIALFGGWTMAPPVMLAYFASTDCASGGGPGAGGPRMPDLPVDGPPATVTSVPEWLALGFIGLFLVGAAVALYQTTRGEDEVALDGATAADDVALDQFAAAAGRAADRIEIHNEDVDNAVYRAWDEMTGLLDVDSPETYAPGEFAAAAIELGMGEGHVDELTTLFNEVRYGDKDIQPREARAVEILRRIEAEYGEEAAGTEDETVEADDEATGTDDDVDGRPADNDPDDGSEKR